MHSHPHDHVRRKKIHFKRHIDITTTPLLASERKCAQFIVLLKYEFLMITRNVHRREEGNKNTPSNGKMKKNYARNSSGKHESSYLIIGHGEYVGYNFFFLYQIFYFPQTEKKIFFFKGKIYFADCGRVFFSFWHEIDSFTEK